MYTQNDDDDDSQSELVFINITNDAEREVMRILGIAVEGLPHTLWRQLNERDRFAAREFWNEMDPFLEIQDDRIELTELFRGLILHRDSDRCISFD